MYVFSTLRTHYIHDSDQERQSLQAMTAVLLGRLIEWKSPERSLQLFEEAATADPSSFSPPFHRGRLIWKFATSSAEIERASKLFYRALELASQSGDEDDIDEVLCLEYNSGA